MKEQKSAVVEKRRVKVKVLQLTGEAMEIINMDSHKSRVGYVTAHPMLTEKHQFDTGCCSQLIRPFSLRACLWPKLDMAAWE